MEKLRMMLATLVAISVTMVVAQPKTIVVKPGDAQSLLDAIAQANAQNKSREQAERLYILVPDGVYDLGDRVLTTITGHQIAIIGQSMSGTIIRNSPAVENEGISKTATLRNRSTGLYLQDLTLQNALDYYKAGSAGRAVCLQDKGTRTICRRVRMLSYQDTYYSDNPEGQYYMESSEIHGTVDFICGGGDVYFNHCALVTERRNIDGSGRNVIAAPKTDKTEWGYVFEGCVVYNRLSEFQYARGWNGRPRCTWLNTTLMSPEKLQESRFEPRGMRTADSDFFEFHTMDASGRDITPSSNVVTFTLGEVSRPLETILTARQARRYQLAKIFPGWRPERVVQNLEKTISQLRAQAF